MPPYARPALTPVAWQSSTPTLTPQRPPVFQPTPYGARPPGQWTPMPGQQAPFQAPGPYGAPPQWQRPQRSSSGLLVALVLAGGALAALLLFIVIDSMGRSNDIAADYQNEDYELPPVTSSPPDLVYPKNSSEAESYLRDNALYNVSMASPVRCEVQLDGTAKSDDQLEEHLQTFFGCLTRAWGPSLEAAGFTAYTPRITIFPSNSEVQTPCGASPAPNAFYCPKDQRIYLSQDIVSALPEESAAARSNFYLITAHEYGHAMQGRTGLITSSVMQQYDAETDEEALEVSRRVETQADCFAGTALNSLGQSLGVTEADRADMLQSLYDIGDDQLRARAGVDPNEAGDHGRGENRQLWGSRGFDSLSLGTCNTFVAPSSEVK